MAGRIECCVVVIANVLVAAAAVADVVAAIVAMFVAAVLVAAAAVVARATKARVPDSATGPCAGPVWRGVRTLRGVPEFIGP